MATSDKTDAQIDLIDQAVLACQGSVDANLFREVAAELQSTPRRRFAKQSIVRRCHSAIWRRKFQRPSDKLAQFFEVCCSRIEHIRKKVSTNNAAELRDLLCGIVVLRTKSRLNELLEDCDSRHQLLALSGKQAEPVTIPQKHELIRYSLSPRGGLPRHAR